MAWQGHNVNTPSCLDGFGFLLLLSICNAWFLDSPKGKGQKVDYMSFESFTLMAHKVELQRVA
jgi:hypothetical protein